jgi:hypothetical protein
VLTLESSRRLQAFVDSIEARTPTPEDLRIQRAIAVLELQGGVAARLVLKGLAAGAPGALVTREAEAALRRLAR